MKLLSRSEEMVLLTVWILQGDAYCVPIREHLMKVTRKKWSFGSIYDPLDRLEKKKLLESSLSEPTKERGGRSKRIYRLTKRGEKALLEVRSMQETMWAGIANIQPDTEKP
jgi:PadR family transcriptional regulator PadR